MRVEGQGRKIWTLGQNVWGNLARGSTEGCPVSTSQGTDGCAFLPEAGVPREGLGLKPEWANSACPPGLLVPPLGVSLDGAEIALGATWTHVIADGRLYSAGWCGDGACGWAPKNTHSMKGEHAIGLVKASSRWPPAPANFTGGCDPHLPLGAASAAYTSSLLLSADGRCVFTFGLTRDYPTSKFGLQSTGQYIEPPYKAFEADGPVVQSVVATYSQNFLVMDDGTVKRLKGPGPEWVEFTGLPAGERMKKLQGNGWSHFGFLAESGKFYFWDENWSKGELVLVSSAEGVEGVEDFSIGPHHSLLLMTDGSVKSFGHDDGPSKGCGRLGRKGGKELEAVDAPAGVEFKKVCAGMFYSMGLSKAGEVYLWGSMNANTFAAGDAPCTEAGETHVDRPVLLDEFFALSPGTWSADKGGAVTSIHCGFYHAAIVVDS